MGHALFYHLTQSRVEDLLRTLLTRAISNGWQVEVRCPNEGRQRFFDDRLWEPAESFLPHHIAGSGQQDEEAPVLLTLSRVDPLRPYIVSVDGAAVDTSDIQKAERVAVVFDGHDPSAVEHARGQWRSLTGEGNVAEYWSEESGRWEKKAEHRPSP